MGSNTSAINAKGSLHINYDSDNGGSNDSIQFTRNGIDEAGTLDMIIKDGNVSIGNNSPAGKLEIRTDSSTINGVALRGESSTGAYFRLYHGGAIDTDGNITAARFIQDTSAGNNFYAIRLSRSAANDSNPDIYGSDNGLV